MPADGGAVLGAVGMRCLKGARPRTVVLVVFGLALVAPVIARATHTGNLGGYAGAKQLCETTCSSTTAHMCTSEELVRTSQLGVTIPTPTGVVPGSWYSAGIRQVASGNPVDCAGWTNDASGTSSHDGPFWGLGQPQVTGCFNAAPVLCCD
jgi:hypothetical protein